MFFFEKSVPHAGLISCAGSPAINACTLSRVTGCTQEGATSRSG